MYSYMQVPTEVRDSRFPEAGVTASGGCELLCGSWGQNLDPLQEQPELFTTELRLQPSFGCLF